MSWLIRSLLVAATLIHSASSFDFNSSCSDIASQVSNIPNTTVFFAEAVTGGSTIPFPNSDPSCNRTSQIVLEDICRVGLNVSTSDRSGIYMEAWLPRNWTGRFLSTGNGGLNGCIQYEDLAYTSALGFASVGANNGHNGTSGKAFHGNLGVVADFAYRSIRTNTVVGKEITKLFYGSAHNHSYYLGCSTGGREGLKQVQDFPDSFDGVVAGAPAANFNNLISWSGRFITITGTANSSSFIPTSAWSGFIHDDILKQCDLIDGVADGVIEDPNLCDYKPESLICVGDNTTDCLTGEQASIVRKVFSPMYDQQGELAYPRQVPGGEFVTPFYTGSPFNYTVDWFHYVVYNDPSVDITKLNMTDFTYAQELNPFNIATWNGDISAFRNRNGKLITYHGQADNIISPGDTELYYEHVAQNMSLAPSELDSFFRFFRIAGMGHCSSGPGAWEFGQTLAGSGGVLTEETLDPERNVLMAMVRWVEEGTAPETMLGTKYVNDTTDLGVQFSRKHCRYPTRNTYDGTGDSTKPESWSCQ